MMKNITTMHGVLMAYNFKNRKEMNQKRLFQENCTIADEAKASKTFIKL